MPVLVAAADAPLGHRIALRLLAEGGEVRAYASGDGDVASLRAAGAFVAVGDLDDGGLLEAAMAEVHTVVHVADPLLVPDAGSVLTATATIAAAAANAGVRRLIASSLPGAATDAADGLRRAFGRAEAALEDAAVPTVVIRSSLLDTRELRDALASTPPDEATRGRPVAPVRPADLVELVVAFDALRSQASEGHVVFAADGPETLTLGAYLERAGLDAGSLVGRRYVGADAAPLLHEGLAGTWRSTDPRVQDAWAFTGVRPAPVEPEAL